MNVLLLSHTTTASSFVVGSHHYLRELNRVHDCRALHISSPDYPFSSLWRKQPRPRDPLDPKVYGIFPLGRLPILDAVSNILLLRQIGSEIYRRNISSLDFILVDQPSFADVAIKLAHKHSSKLIYRPTDVYLDLIGKRIFPHEMKILEHADGIAATSNVVLEQILEKYPVTPSKRVVIENGYDATRFRRLTNAHRNTSPKRLVYVGSLDSRFDFDAIRELSSSDASLTIDLYGPLTREATAIQWTPNIALKGAIDHASVPSVLSNYDAALLPMKNSRANEGRSPMKLYEYLACGLPVLTRATDSLRRSGLDNVYFYDHQTSPCDALETITDFVSMDEQLLPQSWQQKVAILIGFMQSIQNAENDGTRS